MKKNFWQSLWIIFIVNFSNKYIIVNEDLKIRYFIEQVVDINNYNHSLDRCIECNLRFLNNCSCIPCDFTKRLKSSKKLDTRILIYKELILWSK